jgi:uncharacterized protein (DUF1015 family)
MVMGFVPDTSGALAAFLDRPAPPWLSVRDGRGVENRLWREQDPEVQLALAEALRDETAVIADGHHRFAAAMRYRAACAAHGPATREKPYDYAMMLLRPTTGGAERARTHRVFESLGAAGARALEAAIADGPFEIEFDGSGLDEFARIGEDDEMLLGVVVPGRARLLRVRPDAQDHPDVLALPEPLRTVAASLLDALLLRPVAAASVEDPIADSRSGSRFSPNQRSAEDVAAETLAGGADAAFVLGTASPAVVQRIAEAGEVMPPRATKFQPKPVKGLLMAGMVSF